MRRNDTMCVIAGAVAVAALPSAALDVDAVRLDGTTLRGQWRPMDDAISVTVFTEDGPIRLPLDDVAKILFKSHGPGINNTAPHGPMVFHLADGGSLRGRLVGGDGDAVVADTLFGADLRIAFDRLSGIQFGDAGSARAAADLFESALKNRQPGQDALVTREADEPKLLRGRVERLDAERGSFILSEETRTFPLDKAFGVVFAVGPKRGGDYRAVVEMDDGSSVSAHLAGASESVLHLNAATGHTVSVGLDRVRSLTHRSDRVVYVSELPRASEALNGRLHKPSSPRNDRNIAGGPIAIGGRAFERGMGFRSGSSLTFDIQGGFESLAATIGIDDQVRPRGSAVFRVHGDDSLLFDSGKLTGADAARDIVVNVSKVQRLTLEVDFGDDLDLSDYADWGGARLLKPRKR